MNKEEILRKSRKDYSENDGILKEHIKSIRPMIIALLAALFFLFWIEAKYLEGSVIRDSAKIMVYAMLAADGFYCFYLSRKKIWLALSILWAVNTVMSGWLFLDTAKNFM